MSTEELGVVEESGVGRIVPGEPVDISAQESKTLERYLASPLDLVVTVCDDANEACPVFPGARDRLHWSFPDPSRVEGEGRLRAFRDVRDEIRVRIEGELIQAQG